MKFTKTYGVAAQECMAEAGYAPELSRSLLHTIVPVELQFVNNYADYMRASAPMVHRLPVFYPWKDTLHVHGYLWMWAGRQHQH